MDDEAYAKHGLTLAAQFKWEEVFWVRHVLGSLTEERRDLLEKLCEGAGTPAVQDEWVAIGDRVIRKLRESTTLLLEEDPGPKGLG